MKFIYTRTFTSLFLLFVGIAFLFILDRTGNLGFFKDHTAKAYGSIVGTVSGGTKSAKGFFVTMGTIKNLSKENAALNQKIDELSFDNARLSSAKQENSALRRALNFQEQSGLKLMAVEVTMADPTGFTKTITINRGSSSGVVENDAVVAAPGVLVGRVSKVESGTAQVTLITDPGMLINAEVSESGARGIIKGEHGISLVFDLVTQNELIKPGDKIITSGLSEDFPRGLYIGEIAGIRSGSSELFQKAYVTPAADLRNLNFLFVLQ